MRTIAVVFLALTMAWLSQACAAVVEPGPTPGQSPQAVCALQVLPERIWCDEQCACYDIQNGRPVETCESGGVTGVLFTYDNTNPANCEQMPSQVGQHPLWCCLP